MATSIYDPCLLITKELEPFAIVALQTDDTLTVCTDDFAAAEEDALMEVRFYAKHKTVLAKDRPLEFNGNTVTLEDTPIDTDTIMIS
jgi:hypothetical protein